MYFLEIDMATWPKGPQKLKFEHAICILKLKIMEYSFPGAKSARKLRQEVKKNNPPEGGLFFLTSWREVCQEAAPSPPPFAIVF